MDWALAIRRNRDQLRTIVLALFALARMRVGGSLVTLPRSTIAAIMLVLRPAESAVRRLIVIAAQGLALKPQAARLANLHPWGEMSDRTEGGMSASTYRAFPLFDPLKSFDPDSIWDSEPTYESGYSLAKSAPWHDAAIDHTLADATQIGHRLNAILRALNDLPRQARRLKRWELKRDALLRSLTLRCEQREPRRAIPWRPTRFSPMRPGLPPGWRERKVHEIDEVLKECHRLALDRLDRPDTS